MANSGSLPSLQGGSNAPSRGSLGCCLAHRDHSWSLAVITHRWRCHYGRMCSLSVLWCEVKTEDGAAPWWNRPDLLRRSRTPLTPWTFWTSFGLLQLPPGCFFARERLSTVSRRLDIERDTYQSEYHTVFNRSSRKKRTGAPIRSSSERTPCSHSILPIHWEESNEGKKFESPKNLPTKRRCLLGIPCSGPCPSINIVRWLIIRSRPLLQWISNRDKGGSKQGVSRQGLSIRETTRRQSQAPLVNGGRLGTWQRSFSLETKALHRCQEFKDTKTEPLHPCLFLCAALCVCETESVPRRRLPAAAFAGLALWCNDPYLWSLVMAWKFFPREM